MKKTINVRKGKDGRKAHLRVISKSYCSSKSPISGDKIDNVTLDIPLIIRLFEYMNETKISDADLHFITENLIKRSKEKGKALSMSDYKYVIGKYKNRPMKRGY